MEICDGRGICLTQTDLESYEKKKDMICEHNCAPIKCANFPVCGQQCPRWVLVIADGGAPIGFTCKLSFGNLKFTENIECPICLETKMGVKQLNCEHNVCVDCFKRCHYSRDYIPQPQFPYSREIEDEYDNSRDDIRWINDPLIQKYNEDWELYEIKVDETYENEASLRVCPLCRK